MVHHHLDDVHRDAELGDEDYHPHLLHLPEYQNGSIAQCNWSRSIATLTLPTTTTTTIANGHCRPEHHEEAVSRQGISTAIGSSTEWKKILYDRQGVPDNYVPSTFLKDLRKNVNLKKYNLDELILATASLTQQVLLVVNLVLMFYGFNSCNEKYDQTLVGVITSITLTLYVLILVTSHKEFTQIQTAFTFLITCFAASPVLRNLTETVSTDSLYTMCGLMMLVHLASHNYGIDASVVSSVVSLNAAFFASVTLASRLATAYHVFAFLIFATDLFVLFKYLYQHLSVAQKTAFTVALGLLTILIFHFALGPIHAALFLSFLLFINFLCPYIFFRMQELKENIYGPWDEAIINHSTLTFYYDDDHTPPLSPKGVRLKRRKKNQETPAMGVYLKRHHRKQSSDQKKHL